MDNQSDISYEMGTIRELLLVDEQILEFRNVTTEQKIKQRLENKTSLLLIAKLGGKPIGYKLGYQLSSDEFYSWLGGVIPSYRKKGIATQLRLKQESWAKEKGYQRIRVKSMNRYPMMLKLLISSGYHIDGYEDNGCSKCSKICFIKALG